MGAVFGILLGLPLALVMTIVSPVIGIFTFRRNYLVFDEGNGGMATALVFTDKNGNSETYYIACPNGGFGMNVLAPGEYAVYKHTAKAETPVKNA